MSETGQLRRRLRTRWKKAGAVMHWLLEGPMGSLELWTLPGGRLTIMQARPADGGVAVFEATTRERLEELLGDRPASVDI